MSSLALPASKRWRSRGSGMKSRQANVPSRTPTRSSLLTRPEWSACGIWQPYSRLRRSGPRPENPGPNARRILLCGDRRQLASVSGGSALKAVADIIERKATLTDVRRQTVDWQRAASVAMAQGDSEAGLRVYAEHGRIDLVAGREAAQARTIEAWRDLRQAYGDDVLIVTRRNRDAVALNQLARNILRSEGLIRGDDVTLPSVDRDGDKTTIAAGDRRPDPLWRNSAPAQDPQRHPRAYRRVRESAAAARFAWRSVLRTVA